MPFGNPILGGTALVRPSINSPTYAAGSAGWSINADGSAEFNNATMRGSLQIGASNGPHRFSGTAIPAVLTAFAAPYTWYYVDLWYFPNAVDFYWEAMVNNSAFTLDERLRGIYTGAMGVQLLELVDSTGGDVPSLKYGSDLYNSQRLRVAYRKTDLLVSTSATLNAEDPSVANALETWHTVPLSNGWTAPVGGMVPSVRKLPDGNVQFAGSFTESATKANGTQIGTIPVNYRPAHTIDVAVACDITVAGGQSPHFNITVAGVIAAWGLSSANACGVQAIWPINL